MDKFPKVKYPNDPETDGLKAGEVVVTEKLDGANFRFTWDDDHLQMAMMEDLPREVLKDVMEENAWDLLTSGGFEGTWDDDFKSGVRSKASKKCARVLKNEVQSL